MLSLGELKRYHEKGLALIYLRPKSKRPFENGWTKAQPKTWEELENSFEKSYNVGVRLGEASRLVSGKYLGAIDCDVKSISRKAKTEMNEALRKLGVDFASAPIVMSGRGNGSKHIYVQTSKPMRPMKFVTCSRQVKVLMPGETGPFSQKERKQLTPEERKKGYRIRPAWEISFMGTGQQTVLPPSVHPDTGMKYVWASPLTVKHLPSFDPNQFTRQPNGDALSHDLGTKEQVFRAEKVDLSASGLGKAWIQMIREGVGCTDRSASLLAVTLAMCRAQFTDNQILSVLSEPSYWIGQAAYDHAKSQSRARAVEWLRRYTLTKGRYETDILRRFENKPVMKKLSPAKAKSFKSELEEEKDWKQGLQRTEKGGYKNSLTNVELILSHVEDDKVFIHDLFSTRDSYGKDTLWGGKKAAHLSDIDLIKIRRWLSGTSFEIEPSSALTLDAVKFIADRNKIHPVREWLSGLKWDGKRRIQTWMKTYLRAQAEEPYLSEMSQIFLLAMVKRVFEPGCQWDYTVVLEGNQGTYKSTTARTLAGDAWFMDNLPDLRDKDAMLNLQGKWVIELGELADVKRGDYNAVKAYLNRRVDTVRSPYGMLKMDIPRQNVFIGTVNEGEYLKDPTGNRRFWPVKVGICDVEGLRRAREQLFAEAMWIYENCFDGKLMMGVEADQQAKAAQADRRVDDDSTEMEGALLAFIEANKIAPKNKQFNFTKFRANDLFNQFNGPWKDWAGRGYHFQIGAQILSNLGFQKRKVEGQRFWCLNPGQTPLLGLPRKETLVFGCKRHQTGQRGRLVYY